jgi:hypothetical protein
MATNTGAAKKGTQSAKNAARRRPAHGGAVARGCHEDTHKKLMLVKLAESFDATNWGVGFLKDSDGPLLHPEDAFQLLDISPEQVVLLCATGFLKGVAASSSEVAVPLAEVIRFLEENGDWWFQLRGRKQLERLRDVATLAQKDAIRAAIAAAAGEL